MEFSLFSRRAKLAYAASMLLLACASEAHAQNDALGKKVFSSIAEPACAVCHTLKAAGSNGEIGPNLDELKPSEDQVREAVKGGLGAMPSFSDTLKPEQIDAVAKFVAKSVK
jgi:mono/diheme cytochrome c family protein